MVGAKNEPHDVRNEKADVTDRTADADGKTGEDRSGDIDNDADTRHVHAEMHGLFFTGEQEIQVGGGGVNRAGSNDKAKRQEILQAAGVAAWKDRP